MEEPVLARDLRPRRQARTSTGSAAATASSGSRYYRMLPEMGPPETTIWEYPRGDRSWALEFAEFLDDIRLGRAAVAPGCADARAALAVVERDLSRSPAIDFAAVRTRPPMIITRSPLRITLGGGGTDLPSYYREHGGFLDRGGDRQVRLRHGDAAVHAGHLPEVLAARARRARSTRCSIRSSARRSSCSTSSTPQVEITTLADIPAGTGLGSSGSFTTALLKALYAHRRRLLHPSELAELACEIEINRLGEPIGKQDQYIAAYGGVTCFTFHPDDTRRGRAAAAADGHAVQPRGQPAAVLHRVLAQRRHASSPIRRRAREQHDDEMLRNLHYVKELGLRSREALETGDTARVRRADARALGAQEAALGRHEQPADRRVVRARPQERRASAASWSAPAAAAS